MDLLSPDQIKVEIKEEIDIGEEAFDFNGQIQIQPKKEELEDFEDSPYMEIDIKKEEINENSIIILDRSIPLSLQRVKRERRIKQPPVILWNSNINRKRKNPVAFVKREKNRNQQCEIVKKTMEKIKFLCDFCGKTCILKMRLLMHLQGHLKKIKAKKDVKRTTVAPMETDFYTCDLCGSTFSSIYHLRVHIYKHLRSRPQFCYYCQEMFRSKIDLQEHILLKHKKKSQSVTWSMEIVKELKCKICGADFKDMRSWRRHKNEHKNIRNFVCQTCG